MISDLKDPNDVETFLKDFFDKVELEDYVKRLSILYWIKKGRDTDNIKRNLEATQKEIDEAKKLLKTKGIKLAIKNIEAEEFANVWSEKFKKFTSKDG